MNTTIKGDILKKTININLLFFTLVLIMLSHSLSAEQTLRSNYMIQGRAVFLSDIVKTSVKETKLFTLTQNRHSKRIKSSDLIKLLQRLGYNDIHTSHNYIQFTQKSPINTSLIAKKIQDGFLEHYPQLKIKSIDVQPRSFLTELPKSYDVVLRKRFYLSPKNNLYIKTLDNKKIFFNYTVEASLALYTVRKDMKRQTPLSIENTRKKSIMLSKFRAMPLVELPSGVYESKHRLKKGQVLTQRDVEGLELVKRGSTINISIKDANMLVSFSAKANSSGKYGDTITFTNKRGKRVKVRVIGHNRAEIQ